MMIAILPGKPIMALKQCFIVGSLSGYDGEMCEFVGADERSRTSDLLITKLQHKIRYF